MRVLCDEMYLHAVELRGVSDRLCDELFCMLGLSDNGLLKMSGVYRDLYIAAVRDWSARLRMNE